MKVLIVSEGKHELGTRGRPGALCILVERLRAHPLQPVFEFFRADRFHIHPGKNGRLHKRAVGWIRYARQQGFAAVVIVIDEDGHPERPKQFDQAQQSQEVALPRALGVAVCSFDAWMLADETALTTALKMPVSRQPDPESVRDPKSACQSLREQSETKTPQSDMYAAVAQAARLAVMDERCPRGFAPFAQRVRSL